MSRQAGRAHRWRLLAGLVAACAVVAGPLSSTAAAGPIDTSIVVWYGNDQTFGALGRPQTWVNILGRVSDPDGISRLRYSLNGGPMTKLFVGPTDRRVYGPGDFNAQLGFDQLATGANSLLIQATDGAGFVTTKTVTVRKVVGPVWPRPYTINWSLVSNVQSVAQVVDGRWTVGGGVLRTADIGYDRLVDIGDVSWADYEITAPVTVHFVDRVNGNPWPSTGPGIGFLMRWTGHKPTKAVPYTDFRGHGALGWYRYNQGDRLVIGNGDGQPVAIDDDFELVTGVTYIFKMRVETHPSESRYLLKVWPQNQPEPAAWSLTRSAPLSEAATGSVLLVAHHVDASFGNVTITPASATPVVATPTITPPGGTFGGPVQVSLATATSSATIRYTTNGTDPTESSTPYTGPFTVASDTEVRAVGFRAGHQPSAVASASFEIGQQTASPPTISPPQGTYAGSVQVQMAAGEPGAVIRYTLDASRPTASSPAYTGPFTLNSTTTVKAVTFAPGFDPSAQTKVKYIIT